MAGRKLLLLCALVLLPGCGKEEGVLVVTTKDVMEATKGPAGAGSGRFSRRGDQPACCCTFVMPTSQRHSPPTSGPSSFRGGKTTSERDP
jgi:hypothetical protein